jgi:quinol monooxygenase YgiN
MIVVAGYVRVDPANRAAALAAIRAVVAGTRQEAGNISYTFSADLDDDSRFHVFEVWESEPALEAHFAKPHVAEFARAAARFGIRDMQIRRYYVERVAPLRE